MDDQEIAERLYQACNDWSHGTERALQDQEFRIGISSLGWCTEKVRRQLNREVEEPTDAWAAFVGTWVGHGVEQAAHDAFGDLITQAHVILELEGQYGIYQIPGHPDMIIPSLKLVLDNKGVDGFQYVRRHGMEDLQKKFQRHGYGYAVWKAGMLGDIGVEEVRVGNVWHDRSAGERSFHVETEPLDMAVIEEMTEWLDNAVYYFNVGEEAPKEPHRNVCEVACGFYSVCRLYDTDVEGLITQPDLLDAVALHEEGKELKKVGTQMQEEAKTILANVRGSTGEYTVRWIDVPGGETKPGYRRGYSKLEIKRLTK